MRKGMIPAVIGDGCGAHRASPTVPPPSIITPAPPPELVLQHLQKRAEETCGVSGTDLYTCPLDSYCIYFTGNGRWDCCAVSSDSSIAASCIADATTCYGSSASLSAYGTGNCADSVACCGGTSGASECVTAILSLNPTISYSSFFCSATEAIITLTQLEDYAAQTSTATVTASAAAVTPAASTITEPASTVTSISTSISSIILSSSSTPSSSSSLSTASSSSSSSQALASLSSTIHASSTLGSATVSSQSSESISADNASQLTESTFDQHKGAIIGGIVAGIVLILLIALAFFVRHRIKVKKREAGLYSGQEMAGRVVSDGTIYSRVPSGGYGKDRND